MRSYYIRQKLTTAVCFIQEEYQVVDKFQKTIELFLCSRRKRGRTGVQMPCIPFFVYAAYIKSIFVLAGRNYTRDTSFKTFIHDIICYGYHLLQC